MLLWFRNDLRIHDNSALDFALKHGVKEALYLATPQQWKAHQQSPVKIDFILRHIIWLTDALYELGIKLNVINVGDFSGQVNYLKTNFPHENIIANSEVELNEHRRDALLLEDGCSLTLFESDVIVSKGAVLNKTGEMYKVFTPFKKAWLTKVKEVGFDYTSRYSPAPLSNVHKQAQEANPNNDVDDHANIHTSIHDSIHADNLSAINTTVENIKSTYPVTDSSAWPLAVTMENHVLPQFLATKMIDYAEYRDIPSIKGTSGLSPYFAIGAISPRYVLMLIIQRFPDILSSYDNPSFTWLNELVWREFYRHLLFHFPELAKGHNFNNKYNQLPWQNNRDYFSAWKAGKTGYPIVDAAMRQLNQTGWMHNRLRMIVASFLTKHLLIDWRWGERYFNETLIDSDLAANNGGWQWSAGTGCDAQPYFRVFNPITQSQKFDPDGTFIRKYLPELDNVPLKYLHLPQVYLAQQKSNDYWPAIVEHKTARLKALDFYKANS